MDCAEARDLFSAIAAILTARRVGGRGACCEAWSVSLGYCPLSPGFRLRRVLLGVPAATGGCGPRGKRACVPFVPPCTGGGFPSVRACWKRGAFVSLFTRVSRRRKQLTSGPPISSPAKVGIFLQQAAGAIQSDREEARRELQAQADAEPKRRDRSRSLAGRKVQPLKDEDRWVSPQRRRIDEEELQNKVTEEGLAEGREDAQTRQPAPDLDEPMIGDEGGDSTDDRGGAMDEDMDINEGMETDMDITTAVKGSLQEILAVEECYVCPVMLWWAEQGIKVVTKGNTDFFVYAARSLPKNPNIIRQVSRWVGPNYRVKVLPKVSVGRFFRQPRGGTEYGLLVFFTSITPRRVGSLTLAHKDSTWTKLDQVFGPRASPTDYRIVNEFTAGILAKVNSMLPTNERLGSGNFTEAKDAEALQLFMAELDCVDVYRTAFPAGREFTWYGSANRRSRIDMVWASSSIFRSGSEIAYLPTALSDHVKVATNFPVGDIMVGHPQPSLPAWVFQDEEYKPLIQQHWDNWLPRRPQGMDELGWVAQGNALMRRCLHDRLAGSYHAHLATGQEYADHLSALNCGPKDERTEEEWWVERMEAVREWQEWETVETARWGRRSKVGWTVVGEKMSRRFFRELGKKQGIALMTAMEPPFDLRQARQETTLGTLDYGADGDGPAGAHLELRAAVHRYLWAGDVEAESVIPRVAWSKLTQPRSQGGLGILDPELQMTALQLRNLLWFLLGTAGTAWESLTTQHLALALGMTEQMVLVALASPSLISHVKRNQIWSVALTLWKKLQLQQELPVTADDVYNQLLFDNPCICDDTGDPFPWQGKPGAFGKHWAECGFFKIGHLWDEEERDWRKEADMAVRLPHKFRRRQHLSALQRAIPTQWVDTLREDHRVGGEWVRRNGETHPLQVYQITQVQGEEVVTRAWNAVTGYEGLGAPMRVGPGAEMRWRTDEIETVAVCAEKKTEGGLGSARPFRICSTRRELAIDPQEWSSFSTTGSRRQFLDNRKSTSMGLCINEGVNTAGGLSPLLLHDRSLLFIRCLTIALHQLVKSAGTESSPIASGLFVVADNCSAPTRQVGRHREVIHSLSQEAERSMAEKSLESYVDRKRNVSKDEGGAEESERRTGRGKMSDEGGNKEEYIDEMIKELKKLIQSATKIYNDQINVMAVAAEGGKEGQASGEEGIDEEDGARDAKNKKRDDVVQVAETKEEEEDEDDEEEAEADYVKEEKKKEGEVENVEEEVGGEKNGGGNGNAKKEKDKEEEEEEEENEDEEEDDGKEEEENEDEEEDDEKEEEENEDKEQDDEKEEEENQDEEEDDEKEEEENKDEQAEAKEEEGDENEDEEEDDEKEEEEEDEEVEAKEDEEDEDEAEDDEEEAKAAYVEEEEKKEGEVKNVEEEFGVEKNEGGNGNDKKEKDEEQEEEEEENKDEEENDEKKEEEDDGEREEEEEEEKNHNDEGEEEGREE
ncbi:hypothetical protein CBR_g28708 [Chara braunii]|uniref:Uncharacterized protein n=1 Tax=Chara braunii TaxID=69332 RepID=A0A388L9K9_CHABU|nr:hypothetical protein CBR_g28708 [Chara braunii]|eukprot:GBG78995.1 hypothetical protein CBR_g28708 [Chara braunii]